LVTTSNVCRGCIIRSTLHRVWARSVCPFMMAQNCFGLLSPAIRFVSGSSRFPSPPARITPHRRLPGSMPANDTQPDCELLFTLFSFDSVYLGLNLTQVISRGRQYRRSAYQLVVKMGLV
jgi:hypothetical protein